MAEATETPVWREDEQSKVESWRLHVLIEAGFPLPLAERLAGSEVDLHTCVELVARGCEPVVAAEILLELAREQDLPSRTLPLDPAFGGHTPEGVRFAGARPLAGSRSGIPRERISAA